MKAHLNPRSLAHLLAGAAAGLALALGTGCQRSTAASTGSASAPPPPEIPVVRAETQTAPDALSFSGRIEALHRVELRARVTGPLTALRFREGDLVRAGAPLFEIDPRPYQARRDQAAAEAARAQAGWTLAQQELARARTLRETEAISPEELERRIAEAAAAEALRSATHAALAGAEIDLEFTVVRAPVDGRVSRALATIGNLAQANDTILATLVSTDPMRVRFSIDEAALQRLKASPAAGVTLTISGSPREFAGTVDYVSPVVDSATGTAEVRATLDDTAGLLLDGMFARVQLLLPAEPARVLVPETAIGAAQGSRYVLVADSDHKLVHRRVTLGSRHGAQRVITSGVSAGDAVVVAGLQFLREGAVIRPVFPATKPLAQTAASSR